MKRIAMLTAFLLAAPSLVYGAGFAKVGTKRFLVGARYEDDFIRELATRPTP